MRRLETHEITPEEDLLHKIMQANSSREIRIPQGTRWGHYILPAQAENPAKSQEGLRVLAICSWTLGFLTFDTLKEYERNHPGQLNLVGLVTDDPLDRAAKISIKKRFWRYYDEPVREDYELGILQSALSFGIPCYTGEVKNDYFRSKLAAWYPDIIVVSAFGQVIDEAIIRVAPYGIYNIHPSDLLHSYGAGPQPWEDLVARQAVTTRVTLHRVSEAIDDGQIVGQSPLINVRLADGGASEDVRLIGEKTLLPVVLMVEKLIEVAIARKIAGQEGPVEAIDFETVFPDAFKDKLMAPIDPDKRGQMIPLPPEDRRYSV